MEYKRHYESDAVVYVFSVNSGKPKIIDMRAKKKIKMILITTSYKLFYILD